LAESGQSAPKREFQKADITATRSDGKNLAGVEQILGIERALDHPHLFAESRFAG